MKLKTFKKATATINETIPIYWEIFWPVEQFD